MRKSILMVCLGNICRSPLAEGILKNKLPKKNFRIDSAGTAGYHIDKAPDIRSVEIAAKNGIDISNQKARKFTADDFDRFDKIFAMDRRNLNHIKQMARTLDDSKKVSLLLGNDEVPDPYYGNKDSFIKIYGIIDRACEELSDKLQKMYI
ncbi:MAG: low molecular weight protein-tyrosine-phosphatase [Bacteroidota bacterium]|nr:low molecular weight protein-tyrosine-phosphatase [Bacteroidota bacterium]